MPYGDAIDRHDAQDIARTVAKDVADDVRYELERTISALEAKIDRLAARVEAWEESR
jgi:hypothetical protein